MPLFLIILNAVNIERMLKKISSPKAKSVVFMGVMVGISILFFPALRSYYRVAPYPKLYNFIATLPKDALIAGHPSLMDYIPLFAKRKVLVSSEILEPEFRSHYGVMKERVYNFFTAYYATSTREIYDFCERYGVTHLIIDTSQFRREYLMQGDFYFKPFNEYIKKLVHKAFEQHPLMQYMPHEIVTSFALIRIPEGKYLYQQKDIFVVAVADIFPAADGIKN